MAKYYTRVRIGRMTELLELNEAVSYNVVLLLIFI